MVKQLGLDKHLLYHVHIELLQTDKRGLTVLPMLTSLHLIVPKHYLNTLILSSQNDVMPASVFPLPHCPLVPLRRQAVLPTLQYHFLHLLFQVLADTPQTHIRLFLILVQKGFDMVVAKLLPNCKLLNNSQPLDNPYLPEKSITVGYWQSQLPPEGIADYPLAYSLYFVNLEENVLIGIPLSLRLNCVNQVNSTVKDFLQQPAYFFTKVVGQIHFLEVGYLFRERKGIKIILLNREEGLIECLCGDFKFLCQKVVQLGMRNIDWRSFLGEVEGKDNRLAYFQSLTQVEGIEPIFKLIGQVKCCHHLFMQLFILISITALPVNNLLEGIPSYRISLLLQAQSFSFPHCISSINKPTLEAIRSVFEYNASIGQKKVFTIASGFYFLPIEAVEVLNRDERQCREMGGSVNVIYLHYLLSEVSLVGISSHQDRSMLIFYCKQMAQQLRKLKMFWVGNA